MIDISEKQLQIILNILGEFVPDCEIRVFGSRYQGTARKYSDLDIAIVGKEKINWKILAEIKDAFEESDLPYPVDVLDWNAITPAFRNAIEERGFEILRGKT